MGFSQQYLAKNPDGYCGMGGSGLPRTKRAQSAFTLALIVRVRALNAFDLLIKPFEQGFGACLVLRGTDDARNLAPVARVRSGSKVSE